MVYHSQDPMCPSQSKKFLSLVYGREISQESLVFPCYYLSTVLPTMVRQVGNTYGTAVHCSRERNGGGGGNWRMVRSLPLPPTHSAPVFRQRAIVAFWAGELETAAESSRRRRRRTTIGREGGGRKGAPQNFCRCERKWKFSPSASTKP